MKIGEGETGLGVSNKQEMRQEEWIWGVLEIGAGMERDGSGDVDARNAVVKSER